MSAAVILQILRAIGVPGLADLKKAGFSALKQAFRALFAGAEERVQAKALARLKKDGDDQVLQSQEDWTDKDGVVMKGNQRFLHQCLFALPRALVGGGLADLFRDDHFTSWGLSEADTLLAGVTDSAAAVKIVFDRAMEQI